MKKNLLSYLWIMALVVIHSPLVAQTNTVTGTVVSVTDNSPLPGVTVALKGKSAGTVTDTDGKFTINAEPSDVLVFTFIGLETHEQVVGDTKVFNISMTENIASLGVRII